jgi:hypothetical protein
MSSTLSSAASVSVGSPKYPSTLDSVPADDAARPQSCALRIPLMADMTMANNLPKLPDDEDVGVEKEHVIRRDNEPDLKFRGTLLASAAPEFHGQLRWKEYRVYRTSGGRYVFSQVGRSLQSGERDKFQAEIWPSKYDALSVSDTPTAARQERFANATQMYFRWDQVAKDLYRKLGIESEERID